MALPPTMPPAGAGPPGPGGPAPGGPPGGTGPVTVPGAMPGAAAKSMATLKMGLEAMQTALVGLPMGSDLHTEVLKAVANISKHLGKGEDDNSSVVQTLAQLARQKQAQPGPNMAPMMPGGGAPPPPAQAA